MWSLAMRKRQAGSDTGKFATRLRRCQRSWAHLQVGANKFAQRGEMGLKKTGPGKFKLGRSTDSNSAVLGQGLRSRQLPHGGGAAQTAWIQALQQPVTGHGPGAGVSVYVGALEGFED